MRPLGSRAAGSGLLNAQSCLVGSYEEQLFGKFLDQQCWVPPDPHNTWCQKVTAAHQQQNTKQPYTQNASSLCKRENKVWVCCFHPTAIQAAGTTSTGWEEQTGPPAWGGALPLSLHGWSPRGKEANGLDPELRCGNSSSLSQNSIVYRSMESVDLKLNLFYWQRPWAFSAQTATRKGPASFSPHHPGSLGLPLQPFHMGTAPRTHTHLGLVLGEKAGKLCRGSALQTAMGDETKVRGLYSRLPPAGRREGWAGPLEVRLCCHQLDDSVVQHRATIHGGLPGAVTSGLSGREGS